MFEVLHGRVEFLHPQFFFGGEAKEPDAATLRSAFVGAYFD
jgi:hypothetical protein